MAMCLCLLVGCAASRPGSADVRTFGALRAMMHEGRTSSEVRLDELLPDRELYAVGALSELRGEITVLAGEAWLSTPDGPESVRTEVGASSTEGAALLVAARVRSWREVETESAIPFEELDERIAALAAAAGVDTSAPFPFVVRGDVRDLRWHVIDGSRLAGGQSSHEEHLAASVRGERAASSATLVGFYSTKHQGVFTHMGSATHVHCTLEEPRSSGHVDHVTLPAGVKVSFPALPR